MKKRKPDRDWKRIGYELLAFAFFVFLIYSIIVNWQRNEEVKAEQKSKPTTAIIYDKTAENHLFSGMSYIVLLHPGLLEKTTAQIPFGYQTTVSKSEFEALEIGDTIDGYSIQGVFHTTPELTSDYRWFYIILCFVSIYPFGYLYYLLSKIKKVEFFFAKHDFGLGLIIYTVLWGGLLVFLLFMYREIGADLKNGYEKYLGEHYLETVATVTDHHSDHSGSIRAPWYYYLALTYADENGQLYHVTKEVKNHTYRTYKDDRLPISYKKDDPYNVFVQQPVARDVLNFLMSREFGMYCLTIILTVLTGYALVLMNRKRRTGSYWSTSDKKKIKV